MLPRSASFTYEPVTMPMLEGTVITAAGYLPYGGAINARREDAGQGSEFLVSLPITVP